MLYITITYIIYNLHMEDVIDSKPSLYVVFSDQSSNSRIEVQRSGITPSNWIEDYKQTHHIFNGLRGKAGRSKPSAGACLVARWKELFKNRVSVITTEVDGAFRKLETEAIELNGSISEVLASPTKSNQRVLDIGFTNFDSWEFTSENGELCRPNVSLANEWPIGYQSYLQELKRIQTGDLAIILGCDYSSVPFNVDFAAMSDAFTIECNDVRDELVGFDMYVPDSSYRALLMLDEFVTDWMGAKRKV